MFAYIWQHLSWIFLLNWAFTRLNFIIKTHADFTKDLLIDFICLFLSIASVHSHVHLIVHHFRVHLHFFWLLREFSKHISNLAHIHLLVDASHYLVDAFQCVDHVLIDSCSAELHFNSFKLTAHHIVLVNLLPWSHKIFRQNFRWTMLIFCRERLDFLKKFFLLRHQFFLFTINCADRFLDLTLVLFCDFFGVNLRFFLSHFY